ncbi:hypothetical protein GQR58_013407 [Nymphon striatum]|nr:hypothetical protein GQR58_013407 [Nymphon striatum]
MEYCSLIWGGAPASIPSVLDRIQNKAIRLVDDETFSTNLQPLSHVTLFVESLIYMMMKAALSEVAAISSKEDAHPECILYEAAIHSAPNDIKQQRKITAGDIVGKFASVTVPEKDCTKASDEKCKKELEDDWRLLKENFHSVDEQGVSRGTRYCQRFGLSHQKELHIAAFYDLTGCKEDLEFYNLIDTEEFCCDDQSKYNCSFVR